MYSQPLKANPDHLRPIYSEYSSRFFGASLPFNKVQRRWIILILFALAALALMYAGYFSSYFSPPLPRAPSDRSIPHKIWQVYFSPQDQQLDRQIFHDTSSWLAQNPDYTYTLFGSRGANDYVTTYYAHRQDIVSAFSALNTPVLRSDFLRYLILANEGGTYSDIDTVVQKPIDEWIPAQYKDRTRAIVGIEYDQRGDAERWSGLVFPLQFCQWTVSVAPGHPLLNDMIERVLKQLNSLAAKQRTVLSALKPTDGDVGNTTGPVAWTEAVFENIKASSPQVSSWRDLSNMTEPRLYGDILVLPINGFGAGQPHSGSIRDGPAPEALVRHGFRGSWKLVW